METVIYVYMYTNDLHYIEKLINKHIQEGVFQYVESGTVLLFNNDKYSISVEPYHSNTTILISRSCGDINSSVDFIKYLDNQLRENNIFFSIDYQEEDGEGNPVSEEFNISHLESSS